MIVELRSLCGTTPRSVSLRILLKFKSVVKYSFIIINIIIILNIACFCFGKSNEKTYLEITA